MSLTSDDLADIKQLMQAVVSQNNAVLKKEIIDEINARFDENDEKLDVILDALGVELEDIKSDAKNLEKRVTRLEARAA